MAQSYDINSYFGYESKTQYWAKYVDNKTNATR